MNEEKLYGALGLRESHQGGTNWLRVQTSLEEAWFSPQRAEELAGFHRLAVAWSCGANSPPLRCGWGTGSLSTEGGGRRGTGQTFSPGDWMAGMGRVAVVKGQGVVEAATGWSVTFWATADCVQAEKGPAEKVETPVQARGLQSIHSVGSSGFCVHRASERLFLG